jgi:hypothetical protein
MDRPIIIRFVCPNLDGFHVSEYTAYLLIPGWQLKTLHNHEYTHEVTPNPNAFIFIDEPTEAWETAINGMFHDADFIKSPHTCGSCKRKGIKG